MLIKMFKLDQNNLEYNTKFYMLSLCESKQIIY